MKLRTPKYAAAASVALLTLTACGTGDTADTVEVVETVVDDVDVTVEADAPAPAPEGATTIDYWLWDDTQLPGYQQCADAFAAENPDVHVNISQFGWDQYWQNLTLQITAGGAPDVFTNHIGFLRQYAESHQLMDLDQFDVIHDVDFDAYAPGLADMWTLDGVRYGLPKDWDAIGLLYNVAAAEDAGWTEEEINNLTFDANGGTFDTFIRDMTVDANGNNANSPDFDRNNVVRYGYLPGWGTAIGQGAWGELAHSLGFTFQNADGSFNFDSEPMIQVIEWQKGLIEDGVAPTLEQTGTLGLVATLGDEMAASSFAGSWNAFTFLGDDFPVELNFAKVPEGPNGRFTAVGSLGDSIWAGTQHPEEAARWVAFLGSAGCQDIIGESGVVFPAVESGTELAVIAREAAGFDSTPFTDPVANGETFTLPALPNGAQATDIMTTSLQAIAEGADVRTTLQQANANINALER